MKAVDLLQDVGLVPYFRSLYLASGQALCVLRSSVLMVHQWLFPFKLYVHAEG